MKYEKPVSESRARAAWSWLAAREDAARAAAAASNARRSEIDDDASDALPPGV